DVDPLLAKQFDPRLAFVDRHPALGRAIVAAIVEVDHLAYLGEAEADPLAAQDPGEPGPVAPAIDSRQAHPARRDQTFILIEAKRPRRDLEFLAQVGDRIGLPARL